jgi:hypothetical protein
VTDELIVDGGYDSLFSGEKLPSLFNKTHTAGTERSGIIVKAPENRQSRFFKEGGTGALKFWGNDGKPTDKDTGRPVMDVVFVLDTDYRMTEAELAEAEMDEDNGQRGVFASGDMLRAIKDAIKKSGAKTRAQLVGARLTLKRVGKVQKGDYKGWKWEAGLKLGVRPVQVNDDEAFD